MKNYKYIWILLILYLFRCGNSVDPVPRWLDGSWSGYIGPEHEIIDYKINLFFDINEETNFIDFIDLKCGYVLKLDSTNINYAKFIIEEKYGKGSAPNIGQTLILSEIENTETLHIQGLPQKIGFLSFGQIEKKDNIEKYKLVPYKWIGSEDVIDKINNINSVDIMIPENYTVQNNFYGEGIITTLTYPDSSYIFFHIGFNIQLPIIDSDEVIIRYKKRDHRYFNYFGISKDYSRTFHEYDNREIGLNIGFGNVSFNRTSEYVKIINTVKWDT